MPSDRIPPHSGASPGPSEPTGSFANYLNTNLESEIYGAAQSGNPQATSAGLRTGIKLGSLGITLLVFTFVVVVGLVAFRMAPVITGSSSTQNKTAPRTDSTGPNSRLKVDSTDTVSRFKDSNERFRPNGKSRMRPSRQTDQVGAVVID